MKGIKMDTIKLEKLSMKLHQLLDIALKDLRKCDEDERFEVDMAVWCRVRNNKCTVCMAGAVLAQEVHGGDMLDKEGDFYSPGFTPISGKMHAIDDLRELCIESAYEKIYGEFPDADLVQDIDQVFKKITDNNKPPRYRDDKKHFYLVMEQLHSELKKLGI